jgi:acetyl esterase/lipase
MRKYAWALPVVLLISLAGFLPVTFTSPPELSVLAGHTTIELWPHGAPGGKGNLGPEKDTTRPSDGLVAGQRIIRLTNVTDPSITVFQPSGGEAAHIAVVVFPGGGYRILALDLEGTEICQWLNSLGITAFLLKYRVPPLPGVPPYVAPLQDAQRAVGYVRYHAADWHIDPHRIGVIGFSAGGDLGALLSNDFDRRTYQPVDQADQASCRPDFAILIYPAYLVDKSSNGYELSPQLKVTANTPPAFLVQAEDDPVHVENVVYYFMALKAAHVPAEMHIYARGGHGYGLRRTALPVTRWPALAAQWLRTRRILVTSR